MKLIIAGSRTLKVTAEQIQLYLNDYNLQPSVIIQGEANGIDQCASDYANWRGLSNHGYPPEYDKFPGNPKFAPIYRNQRMAKDGDALLLIWDGESRGSRNMKEEMQKLNKPVYEVVIK